MDVNKSNDSKQPHKHHQHNGAFEEATTDDEADNMIALPKEVVRRVNALKNIQLKMVDIETKFYEELHLLECKYSKMYDEYYGQREKIVNGEYEPNEEEGKFVLENEATTVGDLAEGLNKASLKDETLPAEDVAKGKFSTFFCSTIFYFILIHKKSLVEIIKLKIRTI